MQSSGDDRSEGAEAIDPVRFRSVMGRFATGVAVVTSTTPSGEPIGLTVNSLTSVSLSPLLVLISLAEDSGSLGVIRASERFAISILPEGTEELALRFATAPSAERFGDMELVAAPSGTPVLGDALAWLDCRLSNTVVAGDHTLLLGEVTACETLSKGRPLVFFGGRYRTVTAG